MMTQEELEAQATARLTQAGGSGAVAGQDEYLLARQAFANPPDEHSTFLRSDKEWRRNAAGQILFGNGVMVDPATKSILFPTRPSGIDPADVAGSPEWLVKVQRSWSEDKINKWRKTLADQGYEVADRGGMAYDLIEGLRLYHQQRYLNFGEVQPLMPRQKQSLRKQIDFKALKEEVKAWGQIPFEEDLDPDVAEYFADRTLDVAVQLMKRKGWTAEQALAGANLRVQEEFVKAPGVKGALKDVEREEGLEGDTSLRQSMISLSQLGSS